MQTSSSSPAEISPAEIYVIKFGGSSVVSPRDVLQTLQHYGLGSDKKYVVVVSALQGVTDILLKIAKEQDVEKRNQLCTGLVDRHTKFIDSLGLQSHDTEQALSWSERVRIYCSAQMDQVKTAVTNDKAVHIDQWIRLGELFSAYILAEALQRLSAQVQLHAAFQMVDLAGSVDPTIAVADTDVMARILRDGIRENLRACLFNPQAAVAVVPGHPGSLAGGTVLEHTDRGYSDWTAVQVGKAASSWGDVTLVISKEIPGLFAADPKKYPGVPLNSTVTKREIAELAAAEGMKAVNPAAAHAFVKYPEDDQRFPMSMLISDTFKPGVQGTAVVDNTTAELEKINAGVRFVTGKPNQKVLSVYDSRMTNQSGWVEKVTHVFKKYQISIDIITCSSASVILTIPTDTPKLALVMAELREKCESVKVLRENCALVYCVGAKLIADEEYMNKITDALNNKRIPFQPIGTDLETTVSLIVANDHLESAIAALVGKTA